MSYTTLIVVDGNKTDAIDGFITLLVRCDRNKRHHAKVRLHSLGLMCEFNPHDTLGKISPSCIIVKCSNGDEIQMVIQSQKTGLEQSFNEYTGCFEVPDVLIERLKVNEDQFEFKYKLMSVDTVDKYLGVPFLIASIQWNGTAASPNLTTSATIGTIGGLPITDANPYGFYLDYYERTTSSCSPFVRHGYTKSFNSISEATLNELRNPVEVTPQTFHYQHNFNTTWGTLSGSSITRTVSYPGSTLSNNLRMTSPTSGGIFLSSAFTTNSSLDNVPVFLHVRINMSRALLNTEYFRFGWANTTYNSVDAVDRSVLFPQNAFANRYMDYVFDLKAAGFNFVKKDGAYQTWDWVFKTNVSSSLSVTFDRLVISNTSDLPEVVSKGVYWKTGFKAHKTGMYKFATRCRTASLLYITDKFSVRNLIVDNGGTKGSNVTAFGSMFMLKNEVYEMHLYYGNGSNENMTHFKFGFLYPLEDGSLSTVSNIDEFISDGIHLMIHMGELKCQTVYFNYANAHVLEHMFDETRGMRYLPYENAVSSRITTLKDVNADVTLNRMFTSLSFRTRNLATASSVPFTYRSSKYGLLGSVRANTTNTYDNTAGDATSALLQPQLARPETVFLFKTEWNEIAGQKMILERYRFDNWNHFEEVYFRQRNIPVPTWNAFELSRANSSLNPATLCYDIWNMNIPLRSLSRIMVMLKLQSWASNIPSQLVFSACFGMSNEDTFMVNCILANSSVGTIDFRRFTAVEIDFSSMRKLPTTGRLSHIHNVVKSMHVIVNGNSSAAGTTVVGYAYMCCFLKHGAALINPDLLSLRFEIE